VTPIFIKGAIILAPLMLDGIRVLDLCDESGQLAGRILGDMGADVIAIEPPAGKALRHRGPWIGGIADPERSLAWHALNASKRSIRLDLATAAGRDRLDALAARADVWLDTAPPGARAADGLDPVSLCERHPRLIVCAITPFGLDGPYSHHRASDLVAVAMGGNANLTGNPDRAPLRCSMPTAYYHAAPEAALAVAMALYARERTGRGRIADVALHETQLQTLLSFVAQSPLRKTKAVRAGPQVGNTREIWRAADGYVSFGLRGGATRVKNLIATVELMDECGAAPDWLRDYDWEHYNHNVLTREEIARLEAAFGAFFRTRTMRELYEQALKRRILLAPCNDAREIVQHAQLRERELFATVELPELRAALELPDFFAKTADRAIRIRRRAPRLGEHEAQVFGELAGSAGARPIAPRREARPGRIFAGVNMLELGAGAAGPVATRYFAEHGARVIRIESAKAPDFLRILWLTPDAQHGLDGSPMFHLLNPDKESLTVNLREAAGIDLVRRLALEWADVVSENFAPGPMERWGLDAASLRRAKPELVYVSACLFGQTGAQRSYPGFGGQGSAISGFNHLTGWPDREAVGPAHTITDSLAPRFVALAIAAALFERERTGVGRAVDLSQIEAAVYCQSEVVARFSANGEVVTRQGNADDHACPHGVYPCAGDDRWIAIAATSDDEWRALRALLGDPEWARDPALDALAGRLAARAALDARLSEWTSQREPYPLMEELQTAGVPAGVVQRESDLLEDPQLAHRGHWVRAQHAHLGTLLLERAGFRLSDALGGYAHCGPLLGEHTDAILREVLGLDAAEISRLRAAGVLE
jgi:crotonobetainyl-CoA:carnitine CoA-transferase CaiB-like acyl-CoA transferase